MDFKIKQETNNPLLKRKDVSVEVDHEEAGTPSRTDLRKAIASKYGTKPDNVFVISVETGTGTQSAKCQVQVYEDSETARRTVPKHVQIRNLPPDERKKVREAEAKKEEAKPKPEKPAKPAKPEKAEVEKPKEEKPQEVKAKEEKPREEKPKEEKAKPKSGG